MNKAEKDRLANLAIERALELANGDEEAALEIIAKANQETPLGKAKVYNFAWQCRAVVNQHKLLDEIETGIENVYREIDARVIVALHMMDDFEGGEEKPGKVNLDQPLIY